MPVVPTPTYITGEAPMGNIFNAPFDLVSFFFEPWVISGLVAIGLVLLYVYVLEGRLGYGYLGRKIMP